MSIFHNLSEIKDVYCGNTKIESIYLGTEQVYTGETCPYTPDQVIFEQSTAGTYSVDILADGQYEVYCIGGGAGGAGGKHTMNYGKIPTTIMYVSGGGSGAGFAGIINISKGTYSITVGGGGGGAASNTSYGVTAGEGGNSSIGDILISYGASSHTSTNGAGLGGNSPLVSAIVVSQTLNTAGNAGGYSNKSSTSVNLSADGGTSVYSSFGSGGGTSGSSSGSMSASNGTAGYVKIVYKGK